LGQFLSAQTVAVRFVFPGANNVEITHQEVPFLVDLLTTGETSISSVSMAMISVPLDIACSPPMEKR
jgi:hypothetical protein